MKEFIDGVLYIYTQLVDFGINPLSIILIVFITDVLKKNIPVIFEHKLRRLWIFLTGLILSGGLTFLFYFFTYYSTPLIILNIIINLVFSSYSTEILKMIEQIKNHFLPDEDVKK
jgi:hypothetical protein